MNWTEELVEQLRSLWGEGLTTAKIANRLGLSKNAVVGKAHRENLTARPSPIKRGGPSEPKPRGSRTLAALKQQRGWEENQRQYGWRPEPTLPKLPSIAPKPPEPKPVVVKLPVKPRWPHCQWTINDERPWKFCAETCDGSRPYCEDHCKRAYRTRSELMEEEAA